MRFPNPIRRQADAEEGYVLLAVIFLTVALLISLAVAAPKMAMSIQRDKELETIHRGEQYRRALQLYYRQYGNYPTSVDQLLNTNNIRYLRKKYTDPLTGKDDWKPVLYGQAHVHPLGFFGQPLTGIAGVGTTSASMYAATTSTTDANGVPVADSGSGNTTAGPGSSGPGSSGPGSSGPSFGGMQPGANSGPGASNGVSSMFNNSASPTSSGPGSSMFGSSPTSGPGSTGTGFGSSSGASATTFGGGGPIVGFTLPIDKPSLIDYMQQTRYNKWEFNYDPVADQAQAMGGLTNGTSNGGVPGFSNPTGTSPNSNSPFSSSPGSNGPVSNSPMGGPSFGGSAPNSSPTSPQSPQSPQ
jgi:type II secretory pathway pseudopilin PulG